MIKSKAWVTLPREKLRKATWNYKKDEPEKARVLRNNIERNGQVENIIVRVIEEGLFEVVNGNHRLDAFDDLGIKTVICYNMGKVSLATAKRLAVETNETRFASDMDLLAGLVSSIADDFSLDELDTTMPFSAEELDEMIKSAEPPSEPPSNPPTDRIEIEWDKLEELSKKWGVAEGQVWQAGDHRILCGDSALKKNAKYLMGTKRADMMLTDPPYGVSYTGGEKTERVPIENDDLSAERLASLCRKWFDVADIATKEGSYWIATVPSGAQYVHFISDWIRRGVFRQGLVWVKSQLVLGHSEYHYKHESIMFGWKKGDRLKNSDRTKVSVWEFPKPVASDLHPTMKPVEMFRMAIENHTREGDTVYEPFLGSGTTLIACEQTKRVCYAMELKPAYVAVSLQRYKDTTGRTPRLDNGS